MGERSSLLGGRNLSPESRMLFGGVAAIVLLVTGVTFGLNWIDLNILVGLVTILAILVVTIPTLRWVARQDGDPDFARVLILALIAKGLFTVIRYYFITVIYQDQGDAGLYSLGGSIFMEQFRHGIFALTVPELESRGPDVNRIAAVVGLIYLATGVSRYAASFMFSWFCFIGQVLIVRAFRRAVPEGDHRRYAMLVLFLPSMLFWPSSIGKEAMMVLCIGVVSYGASLLLGPKTQSVGIPIFLLGAAGLFYIRPHMALIAVVAIGMASLVAAGVDFNDEADKKSALKTYAIRAVALLLLVGAASLATTQLAKQLGNGQVDSGGLEQVLARTKNQTSLGGSEYTSVAVTSPLDVPNAIMTVLFRPYPWEAHSINGLISASEGLLLAGLVVLSRRRILTWARMLPKRSFLVYALVFSFVFVIAFSYIANFGILARQRTQMMPLVLTMLGMYPAARTRSPWFGERGLKFSSRSAPDSSEAVNAGAANDSE